MNAARGKTTTSKARNLFHGDENIKTSEP